MFTKLARAIGGPIGVDVALVGQTLGDADALEVEHVRGHVVVDDGEDADVVGTQRLPRVRLRFGRATGWGARTGQVAYRDGSPARLLVAREPRSHGAEQAGAQAHGAAAGRRRSGGAGGGGTAGPVTRRCVNGGTVSTGKIAWPGDPCSSSEHAVGVGRSFADDLAAVGNQQPHAGPRLAGEHVLGEHEDLVARALHDHVQIALDDHRRGLQGLAADGDGHHAAP